MVRGYRTEREVAAEERRVRRQGVESEAREMSNARAALPLAVAALKASGLEPNCMIEKERRRLWRAKPRYGYPAPRRKWKAVTPAWFLGQIPTGHGSIYSSPFTVYEAFAIGTNGVLYRQLGSNEGRPYGIGSRNEFRAKPVQWDNAGPYADALRHLLNDAVEKARNANR